jgi:hypothetical protein
MKHVLGLFQHDEIGLEDWAKERVAKAIWSNLEWQERIPRELAAASPHMQQIWNRECLRFFPKEAQQKVSISLAFANKKNDGSSGFNFNLVCSYCGSGDIRVVVPIGNERPVRFKCLHCGEEDQLVNS